MPVNWRSIDLKHLHALRAIAASGTFWAAAEQLNEAQSTVSDHVAALEALTGQRLIERSRGRRTVELTAAGKLLLGHATAIEARLLAAEADFRAFAAGRSGRLRIGIYQSIANKILPEVMRRFTERGPEVDIRLSEQAQDEEQVGAVEQGELDVSFAVQPIPSGPFEVRDLMRDAYVLLAPSDSELAARRPSVADLAGVPMIGYHPGRTEDLAESYLLGHGVRPNFIFRTNDNGTVQAMVAAGLGVALAPLLAIDETDPKTVVIELAEPIPPRVLAAVWHRDRYRPPAAAAFVETVAAVAGEVERAHNEFLKSRPKRPHA
ncbi:LysR family transcriptional regulator [bacterium]|nr:MAG: LysR family transcriptional regulator [bacterium]